MSEPTFNEGLADCGQASHACYECHAPLYPSTAWAHGMRYCTQCESRVVDDGD